MANSGIDEFKRMAVDFRDLGSLAVKGVVALPLLTAWTKLGPPPHQLVAILSSLAALLTIIWMYHFYRTASIRRLQFNMKIALGCFCLGAVLSLFLFESFTVQGKQDAQRIVVGFKLRPEVAAIMTTRYSEWDALRDAEYDPFMVWTKESISIMRVLLPVCWILTFALLACYTVSFVIAQRRRRVPTQQI